MHVRLDSLVTKHPLFPSKSTMFPRNGPKMTKNGPNCAHLVSTSPKTENWPYIGLCGSNPKSEGT